MEEPETLRCVGGRMASSASRCDQFFTKLNDTECVYNMEPERSRTNQQLDHNQDNNHEARWRRCHLFLMSHTKLSGRGQWMKKIRNSKNCL